jgi:phospholipid-binding lipoprotein MlaA
MRFGTNTVFGLFGVMDVASEMGLDHHYEDFGQTLGTWGVGAGAYVVWPLLGPSTVRESFALPFDRGATPALIFEDGASKYSISALQIINARSNLLGASKVLDDIALDKYTFIRDAYLQRRRSLIFDGEDPQQSDPAEPAASAPASTPVSASASAPVSVPAK